jgi:hypothetical protein
VSPWLRPLWPPQWRTMPCWFRILWQIELSVIAGLLTYIFVVWVGTGTLARW